MELLEFVFRSFWHFVGTCILLGMVLGGLCNIVYSFTGCCTCDDSEEGMAASCANCFHDGPTACLEDCVGVSKWHPKSSDPLLVSKMKFSTPHKPCDNCGNNFNKSRCIANDACSNYDEWTPIV